MPFIKIEKKAWDVPSLGTDGMGTDWMGWELIGWDGHIANSFYMYLLLLDEVVFEDVEDTDHLGEDEDLVVARLQLRQQLVNEHELP